ncbi:hypothetical protein Pcinc_006907 [Petrolisthes cinctipes]|uniref:Uncharacterized protein n=1 Tax=Petrolisthes cinctipes TaxID=88211 RepID=A0AAE1GBV5_PETCI|nr:hypothetical protein Pcinc_006907 [Petrolisthes cinctipes]
MKSQMNLKTSLMAAPHPPRPREVKIHHTQRKFVGETYHSASDYTYASFTDSGGATVDPSDVGVQTDDFEIPTPEVSV